MGFSVSRQEVTDLLRKVDSAKGAAKRARERAEDSVMNVVQTVEVVGTGFSLGAINGRFGGVEVLGIPLDLLSGASLHLLAMFMGATAAEHTRNFADGALCSWGTMTGLGVGREMARGGGYAMQGAAGGRHIGPGAAVPIGDLRHWAAQAS